MARFGVRSGSLAFACSDRNAAYGRFERTGANGRERSLALAMQKVEGSSPFIRSPRFLQISRFSRLSSKRHRGAWQGSLHIARADVPTVASCLLEPSRETVGSRWHKRPANHENAVVTFLCRAIHARQSGLQPGGSRQRCVQKVTCIEGHARVANRARCKSSGRSTSRAMRLDLPREQVFRCSCLRGFPGTRGSLRRPPAGSVRDALLSQLCTSGVGGIVALRSRAGRRRARASSGPANGSRRRASGRAGFESCERGVGKPRSQAPATRLRPTIRTQRRRSQPRRE
jgi:hypothetical protein